MRTKDCRDCDAQIVWASHHARGSRMPFDADPLRPEEIQRHGQWFLVPDGEGVTAYPAAKIEPQAYGLDPTEVYVSHFATCPGPRGRADFSRMEPALRLRRERYARRR